MGPMMRGTIRLGVVVWSVLSAFGGVVAADPDAGDYGLFIETSKPLDTFHNGNPIYGVYDQAGSLVLQTVSLDHEGGRLFMRPDGSFIDAYWPNGDLIDFTTGTILRHEMMESPVTASIAYSTLGALPGEETPVSEGTLAFQFQGLVNRFPVIEPEADRSHVPAYVQPIDTEGGWLSTKDLREFYQAVWPDGGSIDFTQGLIARPTTTPEGSPAFAISDLDAQPGAETIVDQTPRVLGTFENEKPIVGIFDQTGNLLLQTVALDDVGGRLFMNRDGEFLQAYWPNGDKIDFTTGWIERTEATDPDDLTATRAVLELGAQAGEETLNTRFPLREFRVLDSDQQRIPAMVRPIDTQGGWLVSGVQDGPHQIIWPNGDRIDFTTGLVGRHVTAPDGTPALVISDLGAQPGEETVRETVSLSGAPHVMIERVPGVQPPAKEDFSIETLVPGVGGDWRTVVAQTGDVLSASRTWVPRGLEDRASVGGFTLDLNNHVVSFERQGTDGITRVDQYTDQKHPYYAGSLTVMQASLTEALKHQPDLAAQGQLQAALNSVRAVGGDR